jgi:hypothetical protein
MVQQIENRAGAAAALANRLRLLQIDLSEQDQTARGGHLADEIDRVLNQIAPSERASFLRELSAHFPTWDSEVDAGQRSAERSAFDERELNDPTFLVTRLIQVAGKLPEQERQAIIAQLHKADLVASGRPAWPEAAAREVRTRLGLPASAPIDPLRVLESLSILADFVCGLDQLIWSAWREIAPTAAIQRNTSLKRRLGQFVCAAADAPRPEVEHDVNKLRQLTASLVAAIPQSWRAAIDRFRPLWPDQIQAVAGTATFGGTEARCWRKYVELTRGMDPAAVEDEIRKTIADYAEALMHGAAKK